MGETWAEDERQCNVLRCARCNGKRTAVFGDKRLPCPTCGGTGRFYVFVPHAPVPAYPSEGEGALRKWSESLVSVPEAEKLVVALLLERESWRTS